MSSRMSKIHELYPISSVPQHSCFAIANLQCINMDGDEESVDINLHRHSCFEIAVQQTSLSWLDYQNALQESNVFYNIIRVKKKGDKTSYIYDMMHRTEANLDLHLKLHSFCLIRLSEHQICLSNIVKTLQNKHKHTVHTFTIISTKTLDYLYWTYIQLPLVNSLNSLMLLIHQSPVTSHQ